MEFIPFKIYIDKTVLEDPDMAEDLGNYIGLQVLLTTDCNMIIISKEDLSEEDEDIITNDFEQFMEDLPDEEEDFVN